MERKQITQEQKDILSRPLPAEAVKQHPTKKFLSSINPIYVTERLNECFGIGTWELHTDFVQQEQKMIVVKVSFDVPEYGIHYECFGGNDNADLGDAYKGATTDALTKICSWLGIGAHVWKNQPNAGAQHAQPAPAAQQPKPKRRFSDASIDNAQFCEQYCEWLYKAYVKNPQDFDAVKLTEQFYEVDELVKPRISAVFANYVAEKKELAQQQYQ